MYTLSLLFHVVAIADITVHLDDISKRQELDISVMFKKWNENGKSIVPGLNLACLLPTSSIAAFFICENRSGLKNLVELYVFGKLQPILEELFTGLLVADYPQETAHIKKLVWELSDYCRCFLYFNPLPKRELFISDPITCSLFLYTEHCSYMKMLR